MYTLIFMGYLYLSPMSIIIPNLTKAGCREIGQLVELDFKTLLNKRQRNPRAGAYSDNYVWRCVKVN